MDKTIAILTLISMVHAFLGFICIIFPIFFSFGIDIPIVDAIAALMPLSFIFFSRCIYMDFYDLVETEHLSDIPDYAEDGYVIRKLSKMIFNIVPEKPKHKLFDPKDIKPICNEKNIKEQKKIYNEKIMYIVSNCIIAILLLVKYKLTHLIPLFLFWFDSIFCA
jgi:hypothetical protein